MKSKIHTAMRGHTLQSLIDQRAEESPAQTFFISPESGRQINYEKLRDSICGCGKALASVPHGDTVGGMLGNGWAAVQLLLAAPYHGRRVMLINLAAGDAGLVHSLRHSGCRLIFVDENNIENLRRVVTANKIDVRIVPVNRDAGIPAEDSPPPPKLKHDADALLIYTSGTTGVPKGVVHTHGSLLASGANAALAHQLQANDRALCVLPLCHINAQCVTIMGVLASGGGVVVPHRFSVSDFWRCLAATECTWFSVVPTIVSHLLHGEEPPLPLPHLRFGRSASAALAPETHKQFEKKFGVKLYETMGLSETGAQILSNPMPPLPTKYGSPGIAFGNEVMIVDKQGKEVACGVEGEIAVRGDNVMRGYLDAPQETAEVFTNDGWFLTGDLGKMDEDGFVFVTGRRKELIIKGGENIAPREIDDALYLAVGVVEAAAFALPCAIYGQRVEAAVVLATPAAHSEEELITLCAREVGKFKAPERVHIMASLPKGPSGKVQRLKLSKMLGE